MVPGTIENQEQAPQPGATESPERLAETSDQPMSIEADGLQLPNAASTGEGVQPADGSPPSASGQPPYWSASRPQYTAPRPYSPPRQPVFVRNASRPNNPHASEPAAPPPSRAKTASSAPSATTCSSTLSRKLRLARERMVRRHRGRTVGVEGVESRHHAVSAARMRLPAAARAPHALTVRIPLTSDLTPPWQRTAHCCCRSEGRIARCAEVDAAGPRQRLARGRVLALRVLRRRRRPDQSRHRLRRARQQSGQGAGPGRFAGEVCARLRDPGHQQLDRRQLDPAGDAGRGEGVPHPAAQARRPGGSAAARVAPAHRRHGGLAAAAAR